jgi:pyruvate formate lyase activating enzyme
MLWPDRCIKCRACISACTNSAISVIDNSIVTDRDKCEVCGSCSEECPARAREMIGKQVSVTEVMQKVERDLSFYGETGGVTISGGEPLAQPVFLHAILKRCKEKGIHTTVDTGGYVEKKILTKISRDIDLFLYDLKVMDNEKHKLYTGVSNWQIIQNLRQLDKLDKEIIIRFPLIPSVNNDKANIDTLCELISGLRHIIEINILPYHTLGVEKAKRLGKKAQIFNKPTEKTLKLTLKSIKNIGFNVKIGG